MARLEEICAINMGQSPDSSTYNEDGNGLPFFQGNADFGEIYPAVRMWCSEPTKIAREKDILISVRAPIGALNIANCECCIGRGLAALTVNEDICAQEYLWHALSGKVDELNSKGTGSTFKAINKKTLSETEIPLPPIDEQRKIAAVLDKVSDLIAKRRQQLDKLDEMIKARFVEIFGDLSAPECKHMRCKLEEACLDSDDIKCGPFGTQLSKDEYKEQGVAVWEIPQINSGFKEQPVHFLTNEKAKQLRAYSLIPGDIAMSRKGNVGRCGLFPNDFAPGIIHSDVLRIRVDNSRVKPCFMMYQLHFSKAVEHQIEMVSSGAVMAGINVTKLKQIYVHIPAFDLQQQFATFVEQTEKIKTTISRSLEKLETLKKALMQEYFG